MNTLEKGDRNGPGMRIMGHKPIVDAEGNSHSIETAAMALSKVYGIKESYVISALSELLEETCGEKPDLSGLMEKIVERKGSHLMSKRRLRTAELLRNFFHGVGAKRYVCVNPHTGESEINYHNKEIVGGITSWVKKHGRKEVDCWKVYV